MNLPALDERRFPQDHAAQLNIISFKLLHRKGVHFLRVYASCIGCKLEDDTCDIRK